MKKAPLSKNSAPQKEAALPNSSELPNSSGLLPKGWHEHHHHLLLGGARAALERAFGTTLPDFRTFFPLTETNSRTLNEKNTENHRLLKTSAETSAGTSAEAIGRLNEWIRRYFAPLCRQPNFLTLAVGASLEQARADGVTVLEASLGVNFPFLLHRPAESVLAEIARVHAQTAPEIVLKLDLGFSRALPVSQQKKWFGEMLDAAERRPELASLPGGVDLYDVEDAQPPEHFQALFRMARQAGLKLKAHVGEFGSAETIRQTVEALELEEIQHGIHAAESPSVLRFLAERDVLLNAAPASNRILHAMEFLPEHPLRRIWDAGVRFTLSTDDFLLFGATITDQFEELRTVFGPEELTAIQRNCVS